MREIFLSPFLSDAVCFVSFFVHLHNMFRACFLSLYAPLSIFFLFLGITVAAPINFRRTIEDDPPFSFLAQLLLFSFLVPDPFQVTIVFFPKSCLPRHIINKNLK